MGSRFGCPISPAGGRRVGVVALFTLLPSIHRARGGLPLNGATANFWGVGVGLLCYNLGKFAVCNIVRQS